MILLMSLSLFNIMLCGMDRCLFVGVSAPDISFPMADDICSHLATGSLRAS